MSPSDLVLGSVVVYAVVVAVFTVRIVRSFRRINRSLDEIERRLTGRRQSLRRPS